MLHFVPLRVLRCSRQRADSSLSSSRDKFPTMNKKELGARVTYMNLLRFHESYSNGSTIPHARRIYPTLKYFPQYKKDPCWRRSPDNDVIIYTLQSRVRYVSNILSDFFPLLFRSLFLFWYLSIERERSV